MLDRSEGTTEWRIDREPMWLTHNMNESALSLSAATAAAAAAAAPAPPPPERLYYDLSVKRQAATA